MINTNKKRGQMEIMGLAMVVILVVIGMTLMIGFSLKPAKKTSEKFQSGQLPETIITSLTEAATDCEDQSLASVIEDCGVFGPTGTLDCDGLGQSSCEFANAALETSLDNILINKLRYGYQVFLNRNGLRDTDSELQVSKECDENTMDIESAVQPLPNPNGVEVQLLVCRSRIG